MTNKRVFNQILDIAYQLGIAILPFVVGGFLGILGRNTFGVVFANLKSLINSGSLIGNPQFYIGRILSLAFPYLGKIKGFNPLIEKAIGGIDKFGNLLNKASRLFLEDFYQKIKNPFFQGDGENSPVVKTALEQIKTENNISQATGENVIELKYIQKPNTKNPNSWIMEVIFNEQFRIGNKSMGQMIVNYCSNNSARTGIRLVKKKGAQIQFGRTSSGRIKASDLPSKELNYYEKIIPKSDNWHVVSAVFEGCSLHGDYLPFLRSHSWGGYYMRRWMTGLPNAGTNVASPFLIFSPLRRFESRLKAFVKNAQNFGKDPVLYISNEARKFSLQKIGNLKLGAGGVRLGQAKNLWKNPAGNVSRLAINNIFKNFKKGRK